MTAPAALPDLGAYRRFVVAYISGKDSPAAMFHLLGLGTLPQTFVQRRLYIDAHGRIDRVCLALIWLPSRTALLKLHL